MEERKTPLPDILVTDNSFDDDDVQKTDEASEVNITKATSESSDTDASSEDEKDIVINHTLLNTGKLTNREKLMSRSFDSLTSSETVKIEEPPLRERTVTLSGANSELKRHTSLLDNTSMKPLSLGSAKGRSLSEPRLTKVACPCAHRASMFSDGQKCICSCKVGEYWNKSTKLVLPPIKINNNGNLFVNRDFCYRVINPRECIENAIIERRGYLSPRLNSARKEEKARNNKQKKVYTNKTTDKKYKPSVNFLPVTVDASQEFKTVIRAPDIWPSKED